MKQTSAIAGRIVAARECVSPPAFRMDASSSSPMPPSMVSMTSPSPNSASERAKSLAASACRSGVPDRAATKQNRNIVRRHMTSIFQCACSCCQVSRISRTEQRIDRSRVGGST